MIGSVWFTTPFFSSSTALNLTLSLALLSSSSALDVRGRPPSLFTGSGSGFMAIGRGGGEWRSKLGEVLMQAQSHWEVVLLAWK